ncbi:MAG: hypothetical protein LC104_15095 [Bacteroidales bacterium]|nr:hypothetical protein [Bacteroidales bacterium]
MLQSLLLAASLVAFPVAPATADASIATVPTDFWQISPEPFGVPQAYRKTKPRAIVLIHGLMIHPLHGERAKTPNPHPWQHPSGALVQGLSPDFDVFGFSYAQTQPIDEPGFLTGLLLGVRVLKSAGYQEIVLVGHSAGGIIARNFVEQFPTAGVTKVLTVAAPHRGSGLARIPFGVPTTQWPFIRSLAPSARESACRAGPLLPGGVEFCCVVCKLRHLATDTVVATDSQWPEDLQAQGIPAVVVPVSHMDAVRDEQAVQAIRNLARGKVIRWSRENVLRARSILFGE